MLIGGQIEIVVVSGLPSFVDAVLNEYLDGDGSVLRKRLLSWDASSEIVMIHVFCCKGVQIMFD